MTNKMIDDRISALERVEIKPMIIGKWTPDIDPSGWFMQEKYDGVRAVWDGMFFTSRAGNILNVPEWMHKGMPATPLDGELFLPGLSPESRIELVGMLNSDDWSDPRWEKVVYMVFDLPAHPGTWTERHDALQSTPLPNHSRECWTRKVMCQHDLESVLHTVCDDGGEGLVIRHPRSHYKPGKSSTTLKVKPHYL